MNTPSQSNPNIYTVSHLNAKVRMLLESEMGIVWLVGEVSNFSTPVSGHWYLSLKDNRAQVKCAMFKGNNRSVNFKPTNGNQVLVKARLSLYEPRGDYQLIIESMQPEGDGRLQQEFEALKMKLAAEGLFAQHRKRALPDHPKKVGIITSQTGAALFDILDVLKRRDPSLSVIIYPSVVQGAQAAISIAQAIGEANERNECDVLIVGRGGGSLEDLWCFNHEIVAQTIAASQIPIVSAVGHEIDVTIADFVADVRAPTPSAAAELVSQDGRHKQAVLTHKIAHISSAIQRYVVIRKTHFVKLNHALNLHHPAHQLQKQQQQLDEISQRLQYVIIQKLNQEDRRLQRKRHQLMQCSPKQVLMIQGHDLSTQTTRLIQAMQNRVLANRHHFNAVCDKLETVSPLATLKRGYSITTDAKGRLINQPQKLSVGDTITTRLDGGEVHSTVNQVISKKAVTRIES